MAVLERLALPLLFALDPERAHRLAIRGLALNLHPRAAAPDLRLCVRLLGLDFPSPVGMAAGFDKNAEAPDGLLRLGFGFVEVGSVTPLPQAGNPKPRMFRLASDRAIINRLGFNNGGIAAVRERLAARRGRPGIVGVNLGANRDSRDRVADYVAGIQAFSGLADYFTVNVSSPNTPGLRTLQDGPALADLLARVLAARDVEGRNTPVLLKIAPDLEDTALAEIAATALRAGVDGIIVANTTLARDGVTDAARAETGGLSGRPLFRRSTVMLARLRRLVGRKMTLVGVGGVDSGEAAWAKIVAGADLVQVYTGMIFNGAGLAAAINRDLAGRVARAGMASIRDAVGLETEAWARG